MDRAARRAGSGYDSVRVSRFFLQDPRGGGWSMRAQGAAVLLAVVLMPLAAVAQEQRGSIDGIVRDASGAVLPGVTVEARNSATGATLPTVSDASGRFRFPSVQIGTYDVTASLAGFKSAKI